MSIKKWANVRRRLQSMYRHNLNNQWGIDFLVLHELDYTLPF